MSFVALGCASHRPDAPKELSPCFNECVAAHPDGAECVNHCMSDNGPRPMSQALCDAAESGLEFLPLPIWDMGPVTDSANNSRNTALGWYSYDDNSTPFRVPGKIYEPTTDPVSRCGDESSNKYFALHLYGGPFQEWGGGFGRMLKCLNTDSTDTTRHPWLNSLNINKYLCGARATTNFRLPTEATLAACRSALTKPENRTDLQKTMIGVCPQRDLNYARDGHPDLDDEPFMTGMALDVSDHVMHDPSGVDIPVRGWEGIAFWGRRSLNSQPGLRVSVADKFVDDDMMYLSEKYDATRPRYCERNVQCGCTNNKPCTPVEVTYMTFDVDGNRVKWAQDPDFPDVNLCRRKKAVGLDGRSLINMSGEALDAQGKATTWPDGRKVQPYQSCPNENSKFGLPASASGQPWQTDVWEPHTFSFCFDPAVDPTPRAGIRYDRVTHRSYQPTDPTEPDFQSTGGATINKYAICGDGIFTSAYPQDSWIRFFCNTYELPGYNYQVCGDPVCGMEYSSLQAPEPKYPEGRTCNPFSFVGSITRSFCYKPGVDPNPYEGTQTCGDFWQKPVAIGTDWTFIKVPFTSMLQQGWAKRQYQFDLSSITNVRFQWERGWMDYQISDVRFYRTKQ